MCGPSNAEQNIAATQSQFMSTLQGNYNTNFANQQAVLANLNQTLQPILQAGPSQQGYSPQELAALNTQAIDQAGGNYKNAAVALNNQLAGRNDSGNLPESGVDQTLKEQLASASAGELSKEQLGITEGNYATGRQNFGAAVSGEEALASGYNPVQTGQLANNANQSAFSEANTINQQQNQEQADIFGGIASLATAAIPVVGPMISGAISQGAKNAGSAGTDVFAPSTPFLDSGGGSYTGLE